MPDRPDLPDQHTDAVLPARLELRKRMGRASGTPEREVTLVDAQAVRAVAHEARQRVIDVLYTEQRPYTSTQLAELTGLSPSAMSYHLRALERWGVVERAPGGDDGRNRPWRASGTTLTIRSEGPGGEAAQDVLFATATEALRRRMRAARRLPPERRIRYVGMASGELWLTDEQVEHVSLLVERGIVELLESGWVNEPAEDRTRTAWVWSLLPDPPVGQQPEATGGDHADAAEADDAPLPSA